MNTSVKIIIGVSVLSLTGIGLYLFLKNKKAIPTPAPNSPVGSSTLTGSSTGQIQTSQINPQSTINQSSPIVPINKPSIQLPNDLSGEEMQAIKIFCSLPEGKQRDFIMTNFNLTTQWGIVNTIYYKHLNGKFGSEVIDYFNGLKKYLGCP